MRNSYKLQNLKDIAHLEFIDCYNFIVNKKTTTN